jgi:hypothetical protein
LVGLFGFVGRAAGGFGRRVCWNRVQEIGGVRIWEWSGVWGVTGWMIEIEDWVLERVRGWVCTEGDFGRQGIDVSMLLT